jgi:hypothetical protein
MTDCACRSSSTVRAFVTFSRALVNISFPLAGRAICPPPSNDFGTIRHTKKRVGTTRVTSLIEPGLYFAFGVLALGMDFMVCPALKRTSQLTALTRRILAPDVRDQTVLLSQGRDGFGADHASVRHDAETFDIETAARLLDFPGGDKQGLLRESGRRSCCFRQSATIRNARIS